MVSLCRGWSSSSLKTACVFLSRGLLSCSELLSLTVCEPVCFGLPSQGIVGFYDYEKSAVERLLKECKEDPDVPESAVHGFTSSSSLLSSFAEDKPKVLVLSLPHGSVVDSVIEEIAPHMKEGDVVIDCGNEWWENTERRQKKVRSLSSLSSRLRPCQNPDFVNLAFCLAFCHQMAEKGIAWIGCGVSGGYQAARRGPSMSAGGDKEAFEQVRPLLEKWAAKDKEGNICLAHFGPGGSGNYVKVRRLQPPPLSLDGPLC